MGVSDTIYQYNVQLKPALNRTLSDLRSYFDLQFGSAYYEHFDYTFEIIAIDNQQSKFMIRATFTHPPLPSDPKAYIAYLDEMQGKVFATVDMTQTNSSDVDTPNESEGETESENEEENEAESENNSISEEEEEVEEEAVLIDRVVPDVAEEIGTSERIVSGAVTGFMSAAAVGAAGAVALNSLSFLWTLMDMLQIMNYAMFINCSFPPILEKFFSQLGLVNFDFLPNFSQDAVNQVFSKEITNQEPPKKFAHYEYTSDFLENGGQLFGLLLLSSLSYVTFKLVHSCFRCKTRIFITVLQKLKIFFEWNYFIRMFLSVNLELTLAITLQLYNTHVGSSRGITNLVICVASAIYLLLCTYKCLKIVRKPSVVLEQEEMKSQVGELYEEFNARHPGFNVAFSFRRYLMCYLLVFFQQVPSLQIVGQLAFSALLIYVVNRDGAYKEKKFDRLRIFTESVLSLNMIVMGSFLVVSEESPSRGTLGWVVISISLLAFAVHIAFMLFEMITRIKEIYARVQGICKRMKASLISKQGPMTDESTICTNKSISADSSKADMVGSYTSSTSIHQSNSANPHPTDEQTLSSSPVKFGNFLADGSNALLKGKKRSLAIVKRKNRRQLVDKRPETGQFHPQASSVVSNTVKDTTVEIL